MQTTLVLTFIADDQPGLTDILSGVIREHQGNWLESKLVHMRGKYTGIIEISIASENLPALQQSFESLMLKGFAILLEPINQKFNALTHRRAALSILGLDRPGIVKELSQRFALERINIEQFNSKVEAAPMSGEPLFKAEIEIALPEGVDIESLDEQIDLIAQQLDIEYQLSIAI